MKLLISLLMLVPASALAVSTSGVGIFPEGREVSSEPWFKVSATPGTTIIDSITVKNSTNRPISFRLYAVDAKDVEGGLAMANFGTRREAGGWVDVAENFLTLPAKTGQNLKVQFKIPSTAKSGRYFAGIIAEPIEQSDINPRAGINTVTRLGVRTYFSVTGNESIVSPSPPKFPWRIVLIWCLVCLAIALATYKSWSG